MRLQDFIQVQGVWLLPFSLSAFTFALLLLFYSDLNEAMQGHLVPGLAVYLLGSIQIIFFKELMHRRLDATRNLSTPWIALFLTLHFGWFFAFLGYIGWKVLPWA